MHNDAATQEIKLLDQVLRVQCPPARAQELRQCAHLVDGKLQEIRNNSKTMPIERIALLAALNIAQELITEQHQREQYIETMGAQIRELQQQVSKILNKEE